MIFEMLYHKYNKLLLNKEEFCHEIGISQATLNRQIKNRTLEVSYTRIGVQYMFSIKSLAKYLEEMDDFAA